MSSKRRFRKIDGGVARWSTTDFDVGDRVRVHVSSLDSLPHGRELIISEISYTNTYDQESVGSSVYEYIYKQQLKFAGVARFYSSVHFTLVNKKDLKPMTQIHSIEERKPCRAREVRDEDGKDVEFGDYLEYDSMSQLKSAISKLISGTIREKNEYRRFNIYRYDSVAGAKEPEIEFK